MSVMQCQFCGAVANLLPSACVCPARSITRYTCDVLYMLQHTQSSFTNPSPLPSVPFYPQGTVDDLEEESKDIADRQKELKVELYGRFGSSINLEEDGPPAN